MAWKLFKKKQEKGKRCVALSFHKGDIVTAVLEQAHPNAPIHWTKWAILPLGDKSGPPHEVLKAWVQENQLHNTPTLFVLNPEQYQFFLLEALEVPEAELQMAAKWRVKDMINFPAGDAAVDAFLIPRQGSGHLHSKMGVIVAKISLIENLKNLMVDADLNPTVVDVADFALRNINAHQTNHDDIVALLRWAETHWDLILSKGDTLFLTRRIEFNLDLLQEDLKSAQSILLSEIERSFLYGESQLGLSNPSQLWVSPMVCEFSDLQNYLAQHLGMDCQIVALDKLFSLDETLKAHNQEAYCLSVGGGLRWFVKHD